MMCRTGRSRWMRLDAIAVLLCALAVLLAPAAVAAEYTIPAQTAPAAAPVLDRSAEANALIQKGLSTYGAMNGYLARMHRELRLKNGRLKIDEMFLRYDKPHTVFLKYTDGAQSGLQVLYSEGHFDGKLMTRPPGPLFDFIPIVAMSPDDPRVKNEESRPIQNAGIGHMIEKFNADWTAAAAAGQAKVVSTMRDEVAVYGAHAEAPVRTVRLEVLIETPERVFPKVVVHFRESDGLPVQMELFKAGSTAPDETYTYYAITLDPSKNDPAFVSMADKRILQYYNQI